MCPAVVCHNTSLSLTLQHQDSAQLKEVFLLYLTFLWNRHSASHNRAVPLTCTFIPLHTYMQTKPTTKFLLQNAVFCQKDLRCYNQHTGRMEDARKRIYAVKEKTILKPVRVQSLEIAQRGASLNIQAWRSTAWHSYTFRLGLSQELSIVNSVLPRSW